MSSAKVVVTDPIMPTGLEELRRYFSVTQLQELPREQWAHELADARALIVRKFRVDTDVLDGAPMLEAVVRHGAGYDGVDVEESTQRGIAVATTPGVGAAAVAEHAVMHILMACRRALDLHRAVLHDDFGARERWRLVELRGKRVGVIGYGPIGQYVASICRDGFGAEIIAFDPFVLGTDGAGAPAGVTVARTLGDLLRAADVVTVHTALTEETRGMIGNDELRAVKDGAIIVNTSRGGIIDEDALAAALDSGKIAAAGLDVFETEPPDTSGRIFKSERVVFSPHIAGLTTEAAEALSLSAARAVVTLLQSDADPEGLINPEFRNNRDRPAARES